MRPGDTASVLAMSWGKGDPQKDVITLVFLDEAGRLREHLKIDNLVDAETRLEFCDVLRRRRPDVIAIGGLSMATTKLVQQIKELFSKPPVPPPENGVDTAQVATGEAPNAIPLNIPIVYIRDDVARLYQHSKRAAEEFTAFSLTAKYCVGLARYAQNPLIEFAALGADITAITFDEDDQHLVRTSLLIWWNSN